MRLVRATVLSPEMVPPLRVTYCTVSELAPMLNVPPDTVSVPLSGSTLPAPRASTPAPTVVPPL